MCGRYAATLPPEMMAELFKLLNTIDMPPRFNIVPTQRVLGIVATPKGRVANLFRWGLVPFWVKDPREMPLMFNARSETMADKPAFRDALRHKRCVIPADGYYEWYTAPDGTKTPYFVTMADGSPMLFAGLYATWSGPGGEEIDSTAIVTVPASEDMAVIHPRTPAVLLGEQVDLWLDTRHVDARQAAKLTLPLPPGTTRYHRVSNRVGSADNDDPSLIVEVTGDEQRAEPKPKKVGGGGGQLDLF
jgi:putative SOS response-associated peptidase YedK